MQRLADAAFAIFIAEGASAVTMRRVAADAGGTTMATYRHFPNREALLRTVALTAQPDFDSQLAGMLDDFLDFALGQPHLYGFLLIDVREDARRFPEGFAADGSPTFDPVVAAVRKWMADATLRPDDPLEVALTVTSSGQGLVQQYLGGRIGLSAADIRALCARTVGRVLRGVKA